MKQYFNLLMIAFLMIGTGCHYLDVVPRDTPSVDHAFSNRAVMKKFLRTCYSHLPDITNPTLSPGMMTSRDELDWCAETRLGSSTPAGKISQGLQNPNAPLLDYWSGRNGGNSMYIAIRDCNVFLENAHIPRDITEDERSRFIAEVKFLKAYYHYYLMRLYGPIAIMDKNIPLGAPPEEAQRYREPIDSVVNYIVRTIDDALPDLPLILPDPEQEMGRINQSIALAVKAKALVWAASPLFNGNNFYAQWIDNRGVQLIPSTYDKGKWERAAAAVKEAIETAESAGHMMYEFNKNAGGVGAFNMNDTLVQLMTIRKSVTEDLDRNPDIIWATQYQFGSSKTGWVSLSSLTDLLRLSFPELDSRDQSFQASYYGASFQMGELFYTDNGVPIDEDKNFDFAGRYNVKTAVATDNVASYIKTNETTAKLHFNREPRYYADLGFDRGFLELASTTEDGGKTFRYMRRRPGEVSTQRGTRTYAPKKLIAFETAGSGGDNTKTYNPHYYQYPIIRMEDLYLLYSEALNEVKSQPDDEVYQWIDKVRAHAGLKGVVESWQSASFQPGKPSTQEGMREIIRRERLIELAFEGRRFYDVRRWNVATEYWSLPVMYYGDSKDDVEYNTPVELNTGQKYEPSPKNLLYPINIADLRANPNLEQTYGW